MKRIQLVRSLFIPLFFFLACCTTNKIELTKKNIKRNTELTKKMSNQFFENNGVSFYVGSTFSISSFVWSYQGNEIIICRLLKGKIVDTKVITSDSGNDWVEQFSKIELFELDPCLELDGDIFGFRLRIGSTIEQYELPIDLTCFSKRKYNSEFLRKIVADINAYEIKW